MKTTSPLTSLFARSPFGPIQEHMRIVERCVAGLTPLLDAHFAGDAGELRTLCEKVFDLEHQADEKKNQLRSQLPSSLFMPVARRDLLDLISTQDAIADAAQDAAGIIGLGRLRIPDALRDDLRRFVAEVTRVTVKCREVIDQLDELLELGFRGREAEKVLAMVEELSAAESETDTQGVALTRRLFDHENEVGPLSIVFTYELFRHLGSVADQAENVGDRLRVLLAR